MNSVPRFVVAARSDAAAMLRRAPTLAARFRRSITTSPLPNGPSHFGAVVSDCDLVEALHCSDTVAKLHSLLYEHGLLLFRDHDHITPADELAFAMKFNHQPDGDAMGYTGGAAAQPQLPEHPGVALVGTYDLRKQPFYGSTAVSRGVYTDWHPDQRAWHNDGFADTSPPPDLTTMRCVKTPSSGGQTLFACSRMAASLLPDSLDPPPEDVRVRYKLFAKAEIALEGTHLLKAEGAKGEEADTAQLVNNAGGTEWPLVVKEAVSGERSMVGSYHVAGLVDTRTDAVFGFDAANQYLKKAWAPGLADGLVYAHSWEVGDIVAWSNRLVIHTATSTAKYPEGAERLHTRIRMRSTEEHKPLAWRE